MPSGGVFTDLQSRLKRFTFDHPLIKTRECVVGLEILREEFGIGQHEGTWSVEHSRRETDRS